jgi:hypothetical protein
VDDEDAARRPVADRLRELGYVLVGTSSDRRRWLCEPMSVSAVVSDA